MSLCGAAGATGRKRWGFGEDKRVIMPCGKTLFGAAALSLVALGVVAANTSGSAQAGPPESQEVQEVPGLRAAPHIPVRTLNGILPDHAPLELPVRAAPPDRDLPAPGGGSCDKDIDIDGQIGNARTVAAQDNDICGNADIDTYVRGLNTFVVQSAEEIAWTHTDVTDPANPVILGQFEWSGPSGRATRSPDVKTFRQGGNDYIALSLERTTLIGVCGVVIVNVNDPATPVIESQYIGSDWCDTHNVFVEDDAGGEGAWVFATAIATADLRVLAISAAALAVSSVTNPVEVGIYSRTVRGLSEGIYVHDVTVVGETVYASYWNAGLDIFDATLIRQPGVSGLVADENTAGVQNIKPADFQSGQPFLVHHAFPNSDGSLVFVQDEIARDPGDEPVQMFDVGSGDKVDGLAVDDSIGDVPEIPAHNLEISGLMPDRLYLGWYKAGLQAWDFDGGGFFRDVAAPRTAEVFHQAQTEANDDDYSGAWGVRLAKILATPEGGGPDVESIFAFQSDRNFGLIVNCLGDGNGDLSGCPAALGGGAPPSNDNFANGIVLGGASGTTNGTNVNATKESGEPNHAGNSGGRSLWWQWTALTDGELTVDTLTSDFDTLLGVYTGSNVSSLTTIASNDDSGGGLQSEVTISVQSGVTYHIAVDGFGGESGNIVLNWDLLMDVGILLIGSCAGPGTLSVFGATPGGQVAIAWSATEGLFTLQSDPCMDTTLELATPTLLTVLTADGVGDASLSQNIPAGACGIFLQALDLASCLPSNLITVP